MMTFWQSMLATSDWKSVKAWTLWVHCLRKATCWLQILVKKAGRCKLVAAACKSACSFQWKQKSSKGDSLNSSLTWLATLCTYRFATSRSRMLDTSVHRSGCAKACPLCPACKSRKCPTTTSLSTQRWTSPSNFSIQHNAERTAAISALKTFCSGPHRCPQETVPWFATTTAQAANDSSATPGSLQVPSVKMCNTFPVGWKAKSNCRFGRAVKASQTSSCHGLAGTSPCSWKLIGRLSQDWKSSV